MSQVFIYALVFILCYLEDKVYKISKRIFDVKSKLFNIEPLPLRRKRNLVKIVHKTSKNKVHVENSRPNIDLRSKPK